VDIKKKAEPINETTFISHKFEQEFTTGSAITLRGFFLENAKNFDIVLLRNVPKEYEDSGFYYLKYGPSGILPENQ